MEKDDIRFRCLELACRQTPTVEEQLARAERFVEFVADTKAQDVVKADSPKMDQSTPQRERKPSK